MPSIPEQTPFNTHYSPLDANTVFAKGSPDYQKLRVMQATVDYMIETYGAQEMLELTSIDNPSSNTIKVKKIQRALEDAFALIYSHYNNAERVGKTLIMGSFRRTQAQIARYYLDSSAVMPRDHVRESFERAITQLDLWARGGQGSSTLRFSQAYQYYNEQPYTNGVSLIRSNHEHKRKFTAASLESWVESCGSNDVYHPLRYNEARFTASYNVGSTIGSTPDPDISPTGTVFVEDDNCIEQLQENYQFDCPEPQSNNAENTDCEDTIICDAPENLTF